MLIFVFLVFSFIFRTRSAIFFCVICSCVFLCYCLRSIFKLVDAGGYFLCYFCSPSPRVYFCAPDIVIYFQT